MMLKAVFPKRQADTPDDGWAPLGSGAVVKALVEFFAQNDEWAVPPHVLSAETVSRALVQITGFEVSGRFGRVTVREVAPPTKPQSAPASASTASGWEAFLPVGGQEDTGPKKDLDGAFKAVAAAAQTAAMAQN